MISKRKNFKRGDFFESKFLVVILGVLFICLIGFLIISNIRINERRAELQTQAEYLRKEIQILEEKKEKLETGILEVKTKDYIEREARDRLGLKKPGEEVVVVLPPEEKQQDIVAPIEKTLWQRILEKLGF